MPKSIVIVPLGRFNPPHKEHENMVNAVIALAKKTNSDARIFVSRTVDKKKNPLTAQEKIKYLRKMYPEYRNLFAAPPISNPTPIGALKSLSGKYQTVHIVLGDDRVQEMKALVDRYNGKEYNFDKIIVHSRHDIINTRVGDLDGVHASDIRNWAINGDFKNVKKSLSNKLTDSDVKTIMRLIQVRLGKPIKEQYSFFSFKGFENEND